MTKSLKVNDISDVYKTSDYVLDNSEYLSKLKYLPKIYKYVNQIDNGSIPDIDHNLQEVNVNFERDEDNDKYYNTFNNYHDQLDYDITSYDYLNFKNSINAYSLRNPLLFKFDGSL